MHFAPKKRRPLPARGWALLFILSACAVGCTGEGGEPIDAVGLAQETPLPKRKGTVLVDGCAIDPWQDAILAKPGTRVVVSEVLLLCLVPREGGGVGPSDPFARKELDRTIDGLHQKGYAVSLGVAFTDETGARYDAERTRGLLADLAFRDSFVASLETVAARADAVDLDFQGAKAASRPDLTAFVSAVSAKLRPAKKTLGIFLPPSVANPSDLPDGEAFDRTRLASFVDRFRVMTLDYSEAAGPTLDPGWATDAVRLAASAKKETYVSVPLYGVDFGPRGSRGVSVLEARGLAATFGATPLRGPTGALSFSYVSQDESHEVWFDDTRSTAQALGAFATSLEPEIGVLYYGFGAEEPGLFAALAERTR
jgi:spore germination protein YaaH